MKRFLRISCPNLYFGIGAFIGIPSACDLVTGIAFTQVEDVVQGVTGSVMAAYLIYCALVMNRGDMALLDTRKVDRIGYAVIAILAAGFLYDVSTTVRIV